MGTTQASGMGDAMREGLVDRRTALHWHLTSNHYPPYPPVFVGIAEAALDAPFTETVVNLPAGVRFRGRDWARASELIESLHLESFVEDGDGDSE